MLMYPHINPIALQIGPIAIHWYGLTYLVGFILFLILGRRRLRLHPPFAQLSAAGVWQKRDVEDLLFIGVICIILGGRLGYVLFYKPEYYFANPLQILMINHGGMSFHGALIGSIIAIFWFCRTRKRPFWQVADFVAPCVPLGFAAGRIGNFINGELWGRPASPNLPWAMVFPQSGTMQPRHPSQIYEFFLEGVLLFIIVWLYGRREHAQGRVAAVFLMGYGVLRFIAEFFREPDAFLGFLSLGMTMGQWLCVPMIIGGAVVWVWAGRHNRVGQV